MKSGFQNHREAYLWEECVTAQLRSGTREKFAIADADLVVLAYRKRCAEMPPRPHRSPTVKP